ncbi:metal ABC transporter substrate-binding protein [Thiomicrospira aerophila AL3]|uniref:Metal ABC transporter substrate-binding protein n=1 Tax=Thiomicrospira aerophila AL3 TaxID=717772 RepID=W0DVP6_9GAMM|nr:zinc ABC transporter substrate-binding protein [Thiomicrospira aerophila]AHF01353.1 metal ABC transporter substrate-binding protein [Thiomicrospira aerophila AL3]
MESFSQTTTSVIRNFSKWPTLILSVMLFVFVSFTSAQAAHSKPLVVSSTTMITDLVNQIGADLIESKGLMGPGIDPHYYRATFNDMRLLRRADLVFYNGLGLEGRMAQVFYNLSALKPTVALGEQLDPQQLLVINGVVDPHIWLSVPLWHKVAEEVKTQLIAHFPEHQFTFEQNFAKLAGELNELHDWVLNEVAQLPDERRKLVTAHDAFGYYGQTYDLEVIAIQGLNTEVEFGLAALQRVKQIVTEYHIPAVFAESTLPTRSVNALINGLAAEGYQLKLGGELLSDALAVAGQPGDTYQSMIRYNTLTIIDALR